MSMRNSSIRSGLLQIFLSMLSITILLTGCSPHSTSSVQNNSLYQRVMQSGTIRCGYFMYPPYCMKDPNTKKLSGIFVDILEEAGKHLGLKIDWVEEVGSGTMIEGLETNRYDLVPTGVWPNASRGKRASFSTPLFYVGLGVYVHRNDNRFTNNLKSINSKSTKISMIDGQIVQAIAENQFPYASRLAHPNMSDNGQLLLDVATKKADVTFAESGIVELFLKHNPGTIQNITPKKPIAIFANTMMFKIGEPAFKSMLDTALAELINTGYVDTILDKYEPKPGIYYRLALPYKN
jgi:ABC-type amino acid transport substrate-binding protein